MGRWAIRALMLGLALLASTGKPRALFYSFTKIADGADGFDDFGLAVILPDGTVVFQAVSSTEGSGVFRGDGGPITTLAAATSHGLDGFGMRPSVNPGGVVSFTALDGGLAGLYRAIVGNDIDLVTRLSRTGEPVESDINSNQDVAFRHERHSVSLHSVLLGWEYEVASPVIFTADTFVEGPSINVDSEVAYLWRRGGIFNLQHVARVQPFLGTFTLIAANDPQFGQILPIPPSLNDAGRAAYVSSRVFPVVEDVVLTSDGASGARIADNLGDYHLFGAVSLNNLGFLVFLASFDDGGLGIQAGPGRFTDRVIQAGDALAGGTVADLQLAEGGLNDAAQVAFRAALDDGTIGIYRADPADPPPWARPGGDYSIGLDDELVLDASASTSSVGILAFEWDLDADGDAEVESESAKIVLSPEQWSPHLGPGPNQVLLRVVDPAGLYSIQATTVTLPTDCTDGGDNDGDTRTDYPEDPGCRSPEDLSEVADCADGLDNDEDGLIDHPDDPGCADDAASREDPQCDDGVDNDGNLAFDHGDDPGCDSRSDAIEAMPGPPPVPDGSTGVPMTARPLDPSASEIEITWDATTCTAADTHLLYGKLGDVSVQQVEGAACGLGSSGTAVWSGVPPDDLWFVLVGNDGGFTESTWGRTSAGLHRAGTAPSLQCGMTARNNFGTCP